MVSYQVINQDLKKAMKQKEAVKVTVLRMLLASLNNLKIEKKADLTDEEVNGLIKKEVKKREEAINLYQKAGRRELVEKEKAELQLIKEYLPAQMSRQELKKIIDDLKAKGELGENFGLTMRTVMDRVKGRASGKLVAEVVRQSL